MKYEFLIKNCTVLFKEILAIKKEKDLNLGLFDQKAFFPKTFIEELFI